jgi:poly(3-hydroxybutyrate) depolymerase
VQGVVGKVERNGCPSVTPRRTGDQIEIAPATEPKTRLSGAQRGPRKGRGTAVGYSNSGRVSNSAARIIADVHPAISIVDAPLTPADTLVVGVDARSNTPPTPTVRRHGDDTAVGT